MLPEQQQRILGYFIEEAKDHLNTIEQGLLDLQRAIADAEMINEMFRAAHSIKGGAAMLGVTSMQQTSHRLEDYFKVLRECPGIQIDQTLESLLLSIFDVMQELLEQLQGPFGLTEDNAAEIMAPTDAIFAQINAHIATLAEQAGGLPSDAELFTTPPTITSTVQPVVRQPAHAESSALQLFFKSDVPGRLRDMLQLFKQEDNATTRGQLRGVCDTLIQAGEQFDLVNWCQLMRAAQRAIDNPETTYRTLAPIVIKELKQGQDLVLNNQFDAITISPALQNLIPVTDVFVDEAVDDLLRDFDDDTDDLTDLFDVDGAVDGALDLDDLSFDDEAIADSSGGQDLDWLGLDEADSELDLTGGLDDGDMEGPPDFETDLGLPSEAATLDFASGGLNSADLDDRGPEVGAAELNSLADLFGGETLEVSADLRDRSGSESAPESMDIDIASDFSDLLAESNHSAVSSVDEDLVNLFGEDDDLALSSEPELDFDLGENAGDPDNMADLFSDDEAIAASDLDLGLDAAFPEDAVDSEAIADPAMSLDFDDEEADVSEDNELFGVDHELDLELNFTDDVDLGLGVTPELSAADAGELGDIFGADEDFNLSLADDSAEAEITASPTALGDELDLDLDWAADSETDADLNGATELSDADAGELGDIFGADEDFSLSFASDSDQPDGAELATGLEDELDLDLNFADDSDLGASLDLDDSGLDLSDSDQPDGAELTTGLEDDLDLDLNFADDSDLDASLDLDDSGLGLGADDMGAEDIGAEADLDLSLPTDETDAEADLSFSFADDSGIVDLSDDLDLDGDLDLDLDLDLTSAAEPEELGDLLSGEDELADLEAAATDGLDLGDWEAETDDDLAGLDLGTEDALEELAWDEEVAAVSSSDQFDELDNVDLDLEAVNLNLEINDFSDLAAESEIDPESLNADDEALPEILLADDSLDDELLMAEAADRVEPTDREASPPLSAIGAVADPWSEFEDLDDAPEVSARTTSDAGEDFFDAFAAPAIAMPEMVMPEIEADPQPAALDEELLIPASMDLDSFEAVAAMADVDEDLELEDLDLGDMADLDGTAALGDAAMDAPDLEGDLWADTDDSFGDEASALDEIADLDDLDLTAEAAEFELDGLDDLEGLDDLDGLDGLDAAESNPDDGFTLAAIDEALADDLSDLDLDVAEDSEDELGDFDLDLEAATDSEDELGAFDLDLAVAEDSGDGLGDFDLDLEVDSADDLGDLNPDLAVTEDSRDDLGNFDLDLEAAEDSGDEFGDFDLDLDDLDVAAEVASGAEEMIFPQDDAADLELDLAEDELLADATPATSAGAEDLALFGDVDLDVMDDGDDAFDLDFAVDDESVVDPEPAIALGGEGFEGFDETGLDLDFTAGFDDLDLEQDPAIAATESDDDLLMTAEENDELDALLDLTSADDLTTTAPDDFDLGLTDDFAADNGFADLDSADALLSDPDLTEADLNWDEPEPDLSELVAEDELGFDLDEMLSGDDADLEESPLFTDAALAALDDDMALADDAHDFSLAWGDALDEQNTAPPRGTAPEAVTPDLDALDGLLNEAESEDDFADLESLLDDDDLGVGLTATTPAEEDFADLDALLDEDQELAAAIATTGAANISPDDEEFGDLERLLDDADQTLGGSPTVKGARSRTTSTAGRRPAGRRSNVLSEQSMRVSVKHLDSLSNLVGELVVNRNTLEQDQERLRQFLDNLLYQVQQLSDVGQRMRDLYERSLLESSLLSSRQSFHSSSPSFQGTQSNNHATGASFDALEMDRFTGFHSLSQEMIELIVRVREASSDIEFIVEETDQVTRLFRQVTTQIQEGLMRSRMVPFAQTADRLPRAVRDISLKCGKQAELIVEGRETLIDKMILEQLYDPMTHLVNNAITHGIETPEERKAAGKTEKGEILVRTFHQGNQTVIVVSDDGAGIDPALVKRKAVQKGLVTPDEAKQMTHLDVYDLLFHPGFSTRDQADDFAGRGVGMDVVRTRLAEMRGAINVDSTIGKGTSFTIRLPLTLSITKALSCVSNRARLAFPMDGVEDMLDIPKERIQVNEQGQSCILWRDTLLPFQPLSDLLKFNRILGRGSVYGGSPDDDMVSIVVLRSAGSYIALQVDQVLGEQEIVIKQLQGPVPKPLGIAGATVLGDGRIMPIADVLELIDLSMGRIRRDMGGSLWDMADRPPVIEEEEAHEPTVLIVDDSITVRELLSMSFTKVGYRVEQARDGQEAWEKLKSGLPCDIVFCDIEMPRMDGLELLSRMQKDATLSTLPIAMLTSRGADRHRQMAVDLGASGYFTKPYLEEALLDAAQRMLKGEVLVGRSNRGE